MRKKSKAEGGKKKLNLKDLTVRKAGGVKGGITLTNPIIRSGLGNPCN